MKGLYIIGTRYKQGLGSLSVELQADKKSCTVPDETMTVRQIMLRHVKGMNVGLGSDVVGKWGRDLTEVDYDDNDLQELARMEHADRSEFLEQLREDVESRKQRLKDAKAAIAKKEAEDKAKAEAEEKERKEWLEYRKAEAAKAVQK